MKKYNPKEVEPKWQKYWEDNKSFEVQEKGDKFYGLVEFPYPSGDGLHVGHPRPFTAMDVICRKKRMQGKNVLFPMGFDAFGLPTENYAIKTGRPPAEVTKENIANFTRQLKMLGYSFDWSRTVDTTDPNYYKWTQWIFLQLYKHGLAYKTNMPINWCLSCRIGLANEEVADGKCERCGGEVEKRDKEQWMLGITKYADKLLEGLDEVDYIKRAKIQQQNWIGRSEGVSVDFKIVIPSEAEGGVEGSLKVFTTRPDTLFGSTYMVVAPEHDLIENLKEKITNYDEIEKYIKSAKTKSDLERTELQKEKTGVELKGIKAINPVNDKEIPVWVADYVLASYGTGAIMAVPVHDERDFEFATKFSLEKICVIIPDNYSVKSSDIPFTKEFLKDQDKEMVKIISGKSCSLGVGININSDFLNGLKTEEAKTRMIDWLEENKVGEKAVNYKLRDWIFSRQRYWGEPIPLVKCTKCGWVPLPESELPLRLPEVKKYEPTDSGESPLSKITDWVNTTCPKCGGEAKRETDTMPNWAGSSWYFLRYCDPNNDKMLADPNKLKYWGPIDWYNGGMEHTVLHLLYSRFWNQFLYDIGAVPFKEPYAKRTSHGMILAEDGEKMSKSRGNVINPDKMVDQFGADAVRTYIMFMGPFDQAVAWDTKGLVGVKRFLDKVWGFQFKVDENFKYETEGEKNRANLERERMRHLVTRIVGEDINSMKFNTAIAHLMLWSNMLNRKDKITSEEYKTFILLLSPFAPHICEELWSRLGNKNSIIYQSWPDYDEYKARSKFINLVVQINGKVRDMMEVSANITEDEAKEFALNSTKVQKWLAGQEPKKVIYVKGKLVSIVI